MQLKQYCRVFSYAAALSAIWAQAASAQVPTLPALPEAISEQARAQLSAMPSPDAASLTITQMRAFADQFQLAWSAKEKGRHPVTITEESLGGVAVRVIAPAGGSRKSSRVLLNLHGGGFQVDSGSLTENVPIVAITGVPVIAVRYRLTPENTFPAAVDDALAVYRALLKSHAPKDIGVYGTSAGAVLGAELIARLLAERLPVPAALGFFSGDADLARPGDSARLFPFKMGNIDMVAMWTAYAGRTALKDPLLSPLYGSLKGFPPTLCITSGRDFLLSATANFCRALELQDVSATTVVFDALPHAFWTFIDAPESDQAFQGMANFLSRQLGIKVTRAGGTDVPARAPAASAPPDRLAARCEGLKGSPLSNTVILEARAIDAGAFKAAFMPAEAQVPAHCQVQGQISSEAGSTIGFEVWLPMADWNGRLYGAGNGGFGGAISYSPGLVEAVQHGAAGVSTDTGHALDSPGAAEDGSWAQGHPERLKDYGYRAVHLATQTGKALVLAFYGKQAHHSYFASCSNGGREGLMEAQRYPEDYDGIVAGAPAYDWTGVAADFIWNARALRTPGAAIPVSKIPAIQSAVRNACSAFHGFVTDPPTCKFDPNVMLCKSAESDACLTAPQVTALKRIYAGPHNSRGNSIYPGFSASGAEAGVPPGNGWDGWLLPPAGGESHQERYPREMLKYFVTGLQTDPEHFDFDHDYAALKSELAPVIDATDPNLAAFAARGGKLILWHGWGDPGLPPQHTIDYFKKVRATLGSAKTQSALRLFMVPGVQHCLGGPGPNDFGQFEAPPAGSDPHASMTAALERWVERDTAPDSLVATHTANPFLFDPQEATVDNARLLCAYPKVAVSSQGNFAAPASFRCELPSRVGSSSVRD